MDELQERDGKFRALLVQSDSDILRFQPWVCFRWSYLFFHCFPIKSLMDNFLGMCFWYSKCKCYFTYAIVLIFCFKHKDDAVHDSPIYMLISFFVDQFGGNPASPAPGGSQCPSIYDELKASLCDQNFWVIRFLIGYINFSHLFSMFFLDGLHSQI